MQTIRDILESVGIILPTGGFMKDRIHEHPHELSILGDAIAQRCAHARIEVVIGAIPSGSALSKSTADSLTERTHRKVLVFSAEKAADNTLHLKDCCQKSIANRRVLVVGDVLNEESNIKEVITAVKHSGAHIIAVATLYAPTNIKADQLGVAEVFALVYPPKI